MYYVLELQTTDSSGAVIPFTYTNQAEAESKYHSLLAVCAISSVPKHGAMLFDADGFVIKKEMYVHEVENS